MTPFLCGKLVSLRRIEEEEIYGPYMEWFQNSEVTHYMIKGAFPLSRSQQKAYYDHVIDTSSNLVLAIECREDHVHIGNVGLHRIDAIHRTAEMGIIIGNKQYWGRGLGGEAISLICRHGFEQLNLNRIELGVFAEHQSAVRLYEKLGFQKEGLKRQHLYKHGRYHDVVIMGMLKSEWPE